MPHSTLAPLPFIEKWLPEDLSGQTVLDYACGAGRHGRLALGRGAKVTFADKNVSGLVDLVGNSKANILEADLEDTEQDWPFTDQEFDVVIVTNYLFRPRVGDLFEGVAPAGFMLYQTFADGNAEFGKPSNPDFLLRSGELRNACPADFNILHFEQGIIDKPAVIQRLAAQRDASRDQ